METCLDARFEVFAVVKIQVELWVVILWCCRIAVFHRFMQ